MMHRQPGALRASGLILLSLILMISGCGIINPSLVSSFIGNPVYTLDRPSGSIVILVMNATTQAAVVRVLVTKQNESEIELSLPVEPFGDPSQLDHVMVVQDCNVESIQLLGGSIASEGGGGATEIPSDLPPLINGFNLSCGKVVSILIQGAGLQPQVRVY
jgi:hypothetical protein